MADSRNRITVHALLALAALATGSLALGCTAQIEREPGESESDESADELVGTPCKDTMDAPHACLLDNGTTGEQRCTFENGAWIWSDCSLPASDSTPPSSGSTPLVLSFDRAPVDFAASAQSFGFDLTGTMSVTTDWPTSKTPWLALDRDGNGRIDDGSELFGSATVLSNGGRASNGFIALRELDDNGDGQITPADAAFPRLLLWSDRDGDRASTARELASASTVKLLSIELGYSTSAPRCDARGNCEIERATFRFVDDTGAARTGEVVDVHLKFQ
jgi:hypothetical protein